MRDGDWSDLPEQLARLAARPGAAEVFGAGADLAAVESQLRVELS